MRMLSRFLRLSLQLTHLHKTNQSIQSLLVLIHRISMNPNQLLSCNSFQSKTTEKYSTPLPAAERLQRTFLLPRYESTLKCRGTYFILFLQQNNSICLSLNEGASNRPSTKGLSSANERGDGSTKSVVNLSLIGSRK